MPRARKTAGAALDRIAKLPRLPDLVIEGGKRPLGVWLREGNETVQPQVAVWLDSRSGFIRATRVISPLDGADDGLGETLEALLEAFTGPFLTLPALPPPQPARPARRGGKRREPDQWSPQPGLPSRVVVDDAALAEAARALLAPLDVPVEQAERLPAFEEAFESLSAAMGADPEAGPPEPFAWEIDPALLPPLYKAAAGYVRRAPWEYMPDHPAIVVRLGGHGPRPGVDTLYACILGGGGMVTGVAFYYSPEAVERAAHAGEELSLDDDEVDAAIELLRQSGAPVDQVPPDALRELVGGLAAAEEPGEDAELAAMEDGLVCFVEPAEESDPTYLAWLAERGLKFSRRQRVPSFFRTVRGSEPQLPDAREVKALTIAIEAINQFVSRHSAQLAGPFPPAGGITSVVQVKSGPDRLAVELSYSPPEDEWVEELEEPPDPASPAGPTTLYRFQVKLAWRKSVWRRIELRGDQTLHDLHRAIQEAFDWDDDHLYAFFLSGEAWDPQSEYQSPYGDGRSAARHRLEQLPLAPGREFLYIFDFGDELRHLVKLEAIDPGGAQAGVEYPRITERRGESVPQY